MSEVRTCVLGGETRARSLFGKLSGNGVGVLVVVGVVGLLLVLAYRSLVLLGVLAMTMLGLYVVLTRRTVHGDSAVGRWIETIWFGVARRRGRTTFQAGDPAWLAPVRELTAASPSGAPIAVLHSANSRGGYGLDSTVTTVLEIIGGGDGLREISETNRRSASFGRVLGALASATSPVLRVSFATRVLPTAPDTYLGLIDSQLITGCPPKLRDSMREVGLTAAANSETYRTFVTVELDPTRLPRENGAGPEGLAAAAAAALRDVVERLDRAGYPTRNVLGPARQAAWMRHLLSPDMKIDEHEDIQGWRDAFGFPVTGERDYVRVDGPWGPWFHAVSSIPRDAWPMEAVDTRWMTGLVAQSDRAVVRTVVSTFELIPVSRAREEAKIALTTDTADLVQQAKRGQVSTGVEEASAQAAQLVMDDLMRQGTGGCRPSVHVHLTASSPELLDLDRQTVTVAAEQAGISRLHWHTDRHHQALALVAPVGARR